MAGTHLELLNPPADTQASVNAVIQACKAWVPTTISGSSLPLPTSGSFDPLSATHVCQFVQHPFAGEIFTMEITAILTSVVIASVFLTGLHQVPARLFHITQKAIRSSRQAAT